jgi:hypothetical protein
MVAAFGEPGSQSLPDSLVVFDEENRCHWQNLHWWKPVSRQSDGGLIVV